MNCELIGNEPGLTAYYQFNQGIYGANNSSITNLNDLTANNFDGVLTNFSLTGTTSNWVAPGAVTSGVSCVYPTIPTLSSNQNSFCGIGNVTLSIAAGNLGNATHWQWYSGSCGGTAIGTGTSITVNPTVTTTYYARAEDGCTAAGNCGSITVTASGPGAPTGVNAVTGNFTITTQTQLDAFFSTVSGTNNGKRWSKVIGNLIIDGSSNTDPISSLCNLSSLTEVTGAFIIRNFTKAANPTSLSQLENLSTVGCNLTIINNTQLVDASLPNLLSIGCPVNINDNSALLTINLPKLQSVKGEQFNIKNNPKLQSLSASTTASSFSFTGKGSSVDISNNGNSATGNLTMNLKKITTIRGALVFNNNDNPGVSNFDNIFTGLTALQTAWGKITVTNNDYLGTCCIAASVTTSGTGKRHIISGNTGNCADSITVYNNCGSFNKKGNSPKGNFVTMDVYPNPSNGNFSLDIISEQAGMVSYTITDMLGRQVLNQTQQVSSNTTLDINMESAQAGQYLIKAQMNGQVFVKRIVVVR
jgi:hypothetical protein